MGWLEDIGKKFTDVAITLATPSYPENGTDEEIYEYYDEMFDIASRGTEFTDLLGIDLMQGSGEHIESEIEENLLNRGSIFSDKPQMRLTGNPELLLHYIEGEGDSISLFENQETVDAYLLEVHNLYGDKLQESEWNINEKKFNNDGTLSSWFKRNDPDSREEQGWSNKYQMNIWYDSRNPEYPSEDGWQFLRYRPIELLDRYTNLTDNEAYNLLGTESIVRRRFDSEKNEFEYQVVENWDLIQGGGSWEESFETILDYGEKIGVRELDEDIFYNNQNLENEIDPWVKLKDFDRENYTPEEFNLILADYMHENNSGFGGQVLEDNMPFLNSPRIVDPYIAEKATELAPNFFTGFQDEVSFSPDYHGWKYLVDNADPFSIVGTSKIYDEDWMYDK